MTTPEYHRLMAFEYAKTRAFRPSVRVVSKLASRNKRDGTGQILRDSRVIGQRIRFISWKV